MQIHLKSTSISIHAHFAAETCRKGNISIHAPHARSDVRISTRSPHCQTISIHAPHARSDTSPPRLPSVAHGISIHAPHARSDATAPAIFASVGNFNPRSSCEERPQSHSGQHQSSYFNPRSSCEERPVLSTRSTTRSSYFNPRSSCEERLARFLYSFRTSSVFQSTLLMRGAICQYLAHHVRHHISIHAPHARSDGRRLDQAGAVRDFNPRSSCEERPVWHSALVPLCQISIHAPHARSDEHWMLVCYLPQHFNPRSSCEERRLRWASTRHTITAFQSTLLMRGATTVRGTTPTRGG